MGDRGNIKVGGVYFYTHWGGYDIPNVVKRILQRKQRWDDEPYLARITYDELTRGHDIESDTGYGITTYECDNENAIYELDVKNQQVIVDGLVTGTFEDYAKE